MLRIDADDPIRCGAEAHCCVRTLRRAVSDPTGNAYRKCSDDEGKYGENVHAVGFAACQVYPAGMERHDDVPCCSECRRTPREDENPDDEWRVYSDGIGELPVFCPECAEREFAPDAPASGLVPMVYRRPTPGAS